VVAVPEVAEASGLSAVTVGKFCRSAGYRRVSSAGGRKPTLWDVTPPKP
jgi:hypothetical protein